MEGRDGRRQGRDQDPHRGRRRRSSRARTACSRTSGSATASPSRQAFSTYDDKKAELLTVNNQLPEFLAGIRDAKIGSRLAVTASAEEAFGARRQLPASASATRTPSWSSSTWSPRCRTSREGERVAVPRLDADADRSPRASPPGFDFTGAPAPTDDLRRVQLIKGTGPRVKKGQTIAVRYLGQVFGGDKPFDENFSDTGRRRPRSRSAPAQVIKGWDQALVGRPGRLPGGPRGPAGARLRRRRQHRRRHQGHRHAGLRDRHPGRRLTAV